MEVSDSTPTLGIIDGEVMTKTMLRSDGSPSATGVRSGLADLTATATVTVVGAARLSYPLLTRTNYAAWAMRMKYLLRANGVWGVIVRESSSEDVDESKNQLALSIISQSIDDGRQ